LQGEEPLKSPQPPYPYPTKSRTGSQDVPVQSEEPQVGGKDQGEERESKGEKEDGYASSGSTSSSLPNLQDTTPENTSESESESDSEGEIVSESEKGRGGESRRPPATNRSRGSSTTTNRLPPNRVHHAADVTVTSDLTEVTSLTGATDVTKTEPRLTGPMVVTQPPTDFTPTEFITQLT
jgi:hypothetical protein